LRLNETAVFFCLTATTLRIIPLPKPSVFVITFGNTGIVYIRFRVCFKKSRCSADSATTNVGNGLWIIILRFYNRVVERLNERGDNGVNVGRMRAIVAMVYGVEARNFFVCYIFIGKVEAKGLEHLFFCEMYGALVELVSKDENGVGVTAVIFVNGARNVGVDGIVRRLA